jgi:ribosomal protein S18 acetylase RimI-like enzyme
MEIVRLDPDEYRGRKYNTEFCSGKYLAIEPKKDGFRLRWENSEILLMMSIHDSMLAEWLDNPVAYGAFENGQIAGFVEGFLEKWNNRFRIANICIFEEAHRHSGVGTMLLNRILVDAENSGARMVVLETQSFNYKAVSFYMKNGFEIIGFDRYAYSNKGPEEHNMRIEMGKKLPGQHPRKITAL